MGIGKRFLNLVRANLNALLEHAAGETRVGDMTDDELEAELSRRRDRKRRDEEMRRASEAAERAARERAARRAAETKPPPNGARAGGTGARARTGGNTTGGHAPPPASASPSRDRLRQLYATLETPYGATLETVKKNFRALMRKHHPDLHAAHPEKHRQATERSKTLTQAYAELEEHLLRRR